MSSMGVIIDKFDIPVCTSFKAKILNDQLCYEVDLDRFKDKDNIEKDLKIGFSFVMDYNEDRYYRQITNNTKDLIGDKDEFKIIMEDSVNNDYDAIVHLNTIGNPFL